MNRYELYKKFIYNFISRESRKPARQPIGPISGDKDLRDDRAKFMQAMAWWVLNDKKENRFLPDEIPPEIIPVSIKSGKSTVTAIREAIVGSVIEPISQAGVLGSKARRYYYFPHKSYLEFLIANYFDSNQFTIDLYRDFMQNVNNEILTFIEEGPPTGIDQLRRGLTHNVGQIDPRIIEACATDKRIDKEISSIKKGNQHPSNIYTHYFYLKREKRGVESYLLARLADSVTTESTVATFNCIANDLATRENSNLTRSLILNCVTNVSIHNIRDYAESGNPIKIYRADIEGARYAIMSQCIKASKREFVLGINELQSLLLRTARGSFFVAIPNAERKNVKANLDMNLIKDAVGAELRPFLKKILEKRDRVSAFLPVRLFGDAENRFAS